MVEQKRERQVERVFPTNGRLPAHSAHYSGYISIFSKHRQRPLLHSCPLVVFSSYSIVLSQGDRKGEMLFPAPGAEACPLPMRLKIKAEVTRFDLPLGEFQRQVPMYPMSCISLSVATPIGTQVDRRLCALHRRCQARKVHGRRNSEKVPVAVKSS